MTRSGLVYSGLHGVAMSRRGIMTQTFKHWGPDSKTCPRCMQDVLQPTAGHDATQDTIHVLLAWTCSICTTTFVTEMIDVEKALNWLMKTSSMELQDSTQPSEADHRRTHEPDR